MKAFRGVAVHPGFTIGPAYVVSTWRDIVATKLLRMPHIIVAPYLEKRMLDVLDVQRCYGIVVDHGSIIDPLFDDLQGVKRPSVIGCTGIYDQAQNEDLIAIDGEEHLAILAPEGNILDYYVSQKGSKCRREPHDVMQVVLRFADVIRTSRLYKGWQIPLDLPDDRNRLFAIARKVCAGHAPAPDEDEYIRSLIDAPPPLLDGAAEVERRLEEKHAHDHDHDHEHDHGHEHDHEHGHEHGDCDEHEHEHGEGDEHEGEAETEAAS